MSADICAELHYDLEHHPNKQFNRIVSLMTHRELQQLQQQFKNAPNDEDLTADDISQINEHLKDAAIKLPHIAAAIKNLIYQHSKPDAVSEFAIECQAIVTEFKAPRQQLESIRDKAISKMLQRFHIAIDSNKILAHLAAKD